VISGLSEADPGALLKARYERYRRIGAHGEAPPYSGLRDR
jgi:hypothetical protein